jgi:16S rRNA (uracil1498-N3)-methyltransferase
VEKFERLAFESAKQCRRLWLMEVEPPSGPESVWGRKEFDLKLIASPGSEPLPGLGERLRQAQSVLVLIGPEGGWSSGELCRAGDVGCRPWSIAPNVLRIESAAASAAAILRYLTLAAGSKD